MTDSSGRSGRRLLAISLASGALFLFVLGLFALIIFRSLSSRLTESVLAESRADAESIARRLASGGAGAPLRVTEKTRDTELYLHSVLQEKRTVEYITVTDRDGRQLFTGRAEGSRLFPDATPSLAVDLPEGTGRRVSEAEHDYDIAVPIENIGFVHVGVSKDAVASRLEKLRSGLVRQTALAGFAALAALAAADVFLWRVMERNRRLEAARTEDRRLSELGTLAAGLAHEIRNPLHAIGLNLQNLKDRAPDSREPIDVALSEVGRLDKLVSDFLLYARPSPLRIEELALRPFLSEAMTLANLESRTAGVTVSAAEIPEIPVKWDGAKVRQVLWNLLRNATEAAASPDAKNRTVTLCARAVDGRVLVAIEDRGPGIAPEIRAKIPALFLTTKKGGSGLGLMVASRILHDHGGSLSIDANPGGGTIVTFELPRECGPSGRQA